MPLTIIRVTIRGVRLPRDAEQIGGVEYSRERSLRPTIRMALVKDRRRRSVTYPRCNGGDLQISVTSSRDVALVQIELGGDQVRQLVAKVKSVDTIAEAVQAVKPLLDYVERNFDTM